MRRVILLHRLLAGYSGVSMGAPPSSLAGCPGAVGVIWSHLPPPYYSIHQLLDSPFLAGSSTLFAGRERTLLDAKLSP